MSRPRRFGHDYIYGLDHFERFPQQYKRSEHRFKMVDIDFCEFCGYPYCSRVLGLMELFRDTPRGIDLTDKGVTITRRLARGVGAPAYVVAYLTERPREVRAEIERLNARVLELTRQWPITRFRTQMLEPRRGHVVAYTPDQWWELVATLHSEHHRQCRMAKQSGEKLANPAWLSKARARQRRSGLWTPGQPILFDDSEAV